MGALCPFFSFKEEKAISSSNQNPRKLPKDETLVNENIRFPEVLVIDQDGNQLGVLPRFKALEEAEKRELDLLCVAPNSKPPVCRILDYGKYRFQQQKKQREAKKNQHIVVIKEIQLTPQIGQHDLLTKARHAIQFLEDGNKLNVRVRFRGRQMAHQDIGHDTLNRFIEALGENAVIEKPATLEGNWLNCIVAPKTKK